jgi:hypothetical protein
MGTMSFDDDVPSPLFSPGPADKPLPRKMLGHGRSPSNTSVPTSNPATIDASSVPMGHDQAHLMPGPSEPGPYSQQSQIYRNPASLDTRQYLGSFDYPSPVSNFEHVTFAAPNHLSISVDSPPNMPPPIRNSSYSTPGSQTCAESAIPLNTGHKRTYSAESPATSDAHSPQPGPPTPFNAFTTMPLTPNSSVGTEDPILRTASTQSGTQFSPPDLRRMSVQSLLVGPAAGGRRGAQHGRQYPVGDEKYTTYGYDLGLPDLDTPHNVDENAIAIFSPPSGNLDLDGHSIYGKASDLRSKDMAFERGGYYAKPVPIKISKSLEPLPSLLLESPMNLLYFHHFLNHTARILVPHDCEKNPFRQILPESMCQCSPVTILDC